MNFFTRDDDGEQMYAPIEYREYHIILSDYEKSLILRILEQAMQSNNIFLPADLGAIEQVKNQLKEPKS